MATWLLFRTSVNFAPMRNIYLAQFVCLKTERTSVLKMWRQLFKMDLNTFIPSSPNRLFCATQSENVADLWIFHARRWKISNFLDILEQSINHIPEPILTMIFMIIIHVTALQLTNSASRLGKNKSSSWSHFTQYEQCLHCIWGVPLRSRIWLEELSFLV